MATHGHHDWHVPWTSFSKAKQIEFFDDCVVKITTLMHKNHTKEEFDLIAEHFLWPYYDDLTRCRLHHAYRRIIWPYYECAFARPRRRKSGKKEKEEITTARSM